MNLDCSEYQSLFLELDFVRILKPFYVWLVNFERDLTVPLTLRFRSIRLLKRAVTGLLTVAQMCRGVSSQLVYTVEDEE